MVYSPINGNGGRYEYFKCYTRYSRRSDCQSAHVSVDLVEAQIERFYQTYPWLTEADKDRARSAVRHYGEKQLRGPNKMSSGVW